MNAYVTVNGVKMTKLYPEGGAEAPPVADAAKICWRPRCAATRIRAPKYAPGKFFSLRSRPIDPLPAKTKKEGYTKVYPSFWSGRRGSTRYRHPTNGRAIRRSPAGPLDLTRCAQVEAASSSLPATFQKENTILTDGVFFLERATRLELATSTLARSLSTR